MGRQQALILAVGWIITEVGRLSLVIACAVISNGEGMRG